jgi:hypothetical protein
LIRLEKRRNFFVHAVVIPVLTIHGSKEFDTKLQYDGVRLGNVLSPGELRGRLEDSHLDAGG